VLRLAALAAAALGIAGGGRALAECAAWPGEPDPLPQVDSADPGAARWAGLRAAELAALAAEAEPRSRAVAHGLWRHVGCIDPGRAELADALERTLPVRLRQPALAWVREPRPGPRRSAAEAARGLDAPISLASLGRPPPVGAGGPVAVARGGQALAEAQQALRQARFEEALARVERARAELPAEAGLRETRVSLEIVAATASLALGREGDARASFERALDEDPSLELDPASHAPKVYRLFRSVRLAREEPS